MSTIDSFQTRQAQTQGADDFLTVEEVAEFCPDCAELMTKKGITRISATKILESLFESRQAQKGGPGNIATLIKHWKKEAHPFTACKKWVEAHRGEADYPDIKDSDSFCGKLKHLVED